MFFRIEERFPLYRGYRVIPVAEHVIACKADRMKFEFTASGYAVNVTIQLVDGEDVLYGLQGLYEAIDASYDEAGQ